MKDQHLHIVSFQHPVPADYGGVIDVYFKLKSLKENGWRITLHSYIYNGRQPAAPPFFGPDDRVFYYERNTGVISNLSLKPYIVQSRRDPRLLENLLLDNSPIIFEGLHTTELLCDPLLSARFKIVRTHNIEHDYYSGLAHATHTLRERAFFSLESLRLKKYEKVLAHADMIAAISGTDRDGLSRRYPGVPVSLIPCFYDDAPPPELPGKGDYVLYQGSLDVAENHRAAMRIAEEIAPLIPDIRFVIAGRNPDTRLMEAIEKCQNVSLSPNLPADEFNILMTRARVHLLITDQPTGVKLKLLNALCRGAHVVVNSAMTQGTGLESLVETGDTPGDIARAVERKMKESFSGRIIPDLYDNRKNASVLTQMIE